MDATAELLEEMGFDRLNTNIICERAGLTPPALYRYFPNKYAVLKALGERLMTVQNEALIAFTDSIGNARPTARSTAAVLRSQYEVTRKEKGAAWIMRALHATPQLSEVRLESHRSMVDHFVAMYTHRDPDADHAELGRQARIAVETGYGLLEMLFDNPGMDVDATLEDFGVMIAALLARQETSR